MSNKKIIIVTSIIIICIIIFFIFYLLFIKPIIVGDYIPDSSDCDKAYDCVCLQDTCVCSYKKWFWENKLSCEKNKIKENQMEKK